MANLQQFGRNLSRTAGPSSNQNPCKFVKLKRSSHTWGLAAPPPSLRLAARKKREKKLGFEFVLDSRGLAAPAGIGARSSPAARRAACARAACPAAEAPPDGAGVHRNGPGGVQAGHSSLRPLGPYSIAAPARRQRDDEDYRAGVGFPGLVPAAAAAEVAAAAVAAGGGAGSAAAAAAAGARRCRSRHAGRGAHAAPGAAGGRPPPEREAREEVRAGPRRQEGAGNRPGRQRRRPSLLSRTHSGSPAQAPPPHSPAIFSARHRRLLQARLPPPPPPPAQPRLERAHPARPPPPSAHDEARCRPLPRAWPPSPCLHAPL